MNMEQWLVEVSQAYQLSGKTLSHDKKAIILSELSDNIAPAHKEIMADTYNAITRFFYNKATRGELFGSLSRISEKFGSSLEENYGVTSGPFLNMAKAYWTFKIEVQDLFPEHHKSALAQVLLKIENDIAGVFFPTPGISMPVSLRKMTQRQILKEYAPTIDIERFISENPILGAGGGRSGCLGTTLMLIFIPIALGWLLFL